MTTVLQLYQDQIQNQSEITILGWVRSNRSSGKLGFLVVNDGTIFDNVQIVYKAEQLTNFLELSGVRVSSAVKVTGKFCLTPTAKQQFEIQASNIEILDQASEDYPLQKKNTLMNIYVKLHIYEQKLILLMQFFEFVAAVLLQFTNSLTKIILFMFILQLLQGMMLKELVNHLLLQQEPMIIMPKISLAKKLV